MDKSVKANNYKYLAGFGLFNVVVEYLILFQATFNLAEIDAAMKSAFVMAILTVATIAIDGVLTEQVKARLIFRKWKHPLPGCEAFTKYMKADPRFDAKVIEKRYKPLPKDPGEQNKLWYSIYHRHREKPHILGSLGRFMLMRDAGVIALLLAVVVLAIALWSSTPPVVSVGAVAILVVEYVIASIAAKTFGIALVTDVLAEEALGRGAH